MTNKRNAAGGPTPQQIRDEVSVDPLLLDPALWSLSERPAPLDIATECARAMEVGRFAKRGKTYAQTVYVVLLSPHDFARFDDRRRELIATLKDTLVWWARRNGYALPGEIRIKIEQDDRMQPGQLSVEAGLRADEASGLGARRRFVD